MDIKESIKMADVLSDLFPWNLFSWITGPRSFAFFCYKSKWANQL